MESVPTMGELLCETKNMGFKCGIIGLPNVGKSTLFNALTNAGIAASNYPFCTIEPNTGIVPVPDERIDKLSEIVKPAQTINTTIEFVDIAGLVKGASKGEGLGNKFLANIRETDAIAHVVRCFEHDNIVHVEGKIDPLNDIETINTELILADIESTQRALDKATKNSKNGDKGAIWLKKLLTLLLDHLNLGKPARSFAANSSELDAIKALQLLSAKPTLYIANVSENGFSNNPYLDQVIKRSDQENAKIVAINASIEAEISDLNDTDKKIFLEELGLEEPGLNRVIRTGYELLDLQTFFTAGPKEVRAWTIPKNATAPQAAGKIHTDFEKGFIRAEIISYCDFVKHNGEQGAKQAGKWRLEGKNYIVQDGDVVHFRFNV